MNNIPFTNNEKLRRLMGIYKYNNIRVIPARQCPRLDQYFIDEYHPRIGVVFTRRFGSVCKIGIISLHIMSDDTTQY